MKKIIFTLLFLFIGYNNVFSAINPVIDLNANYVDENTFSFRFNDITQTNVSYTLSGVVHIYNPAIDSTGSLIYDRSGIVSDNMLFTGAILDNTYLLEFYDNFAGTSNTHQYYYKHTNPISVTVSGSTTTNNHNTIIYNDTNGSIFSVEQITEIITLEIVFVLLGLIIFIFVKNFTSIG